MLTPQQFLSHIADRDLPTLERAIGLLYLAGEADPSLGMTAREIDEHLHSAGYARQNISRLNGALKADRRTVRFLSDGWRLTPSARSELSKMYSFVRAPKSLPERDSVLPHGLFARTRGYIDRVVYQLNQSYDLGLFDCCAVMGRRLLETLIIEMYERQNRADALKGPDGHFLMLSGLLSIVEKDKSLSVSRNAMKGLKDFKTLGDLSAHNRRFNAQMSDIDRVRDGLRVATEELLHLSGLHSSSKDKTTMDEPA